MNDIEQTSARFLDRLGKYMDALWARLQIPMDVFVYTPEEFENISWKPFIQKAINEGIVVYEHRKAA